MDLSEKFIKGLEDYNLTQLDIITQNFKYCGGNMGSHYNYFKICFKSELKQNPSWCPAEKEICICGHKITENCYIINDSKRILTLGSCCIKRFIPKSSRTCEICGEPHRNRIINKCNDCRVGFCDKCNKECNKKYKLCWDCFTNHDDLEETDDSSDSDKIINFGKYKGKKYKNILDKDMKYLYWLSNQDWCKDKEYIKTLFTQKT